MVVKINKSLAKELEDARKQILDQKSGLVTIPTPPKGKEYLAWTSDPSNPFYDTRKTLAMRLVESHFGRPIQEIIAGDLKGSDVARRIGISRSGVSRWRKRLGIVVQKGND